MKLRIIKNITKKSITVEGILIPAGKTTTVNDFNFNTQLYRDLIKNGILKEVKQDKIEIKTARKVKVKPAVDSEIIIKEK